MESDLLIANPARIRTSSKLIVTDGVAFDEVQELVVSPNDVIGYTDRVDNGIVALTRYSLQVW